MDILAGKLHSGSEHSSISIRARINKSCVGPRGAIFVTDAAYYIDFLQIFGPSQPLLSFKAWKSMLGNYKEEK